MLRTALSLASITGLPMRMFNVRAGRKGAGRPGLKPQHSLSARAAAGITGGEVRGAEPGSMSVTYLPGQLKPGRYSFDVGTAGSTGLILQTVLPALFFAGASSIVQITGGTHVPWSPPADYLAEVFLPAIEPMGLNACLSTVKRGYYPGGGGSVEAVVSPAETPLAPLRIKERGHLRFLRVTSTVSNLPLSIAERQLQSALSALSDYSARLEGKSVEAPSPGRGTSVFILAGFEFVNAGFTALGARGKRAETVGSEAADSFLSYAGKQGALDRHLSDQALLFMALASGESFFTAAELTAHIFTNIHVIEKFLPVRFQVEGIPGGEGTIRVEGASFAMP